MLGSNGGRRKVTRMILALYSCTSVKARCLAQKRQVALWGDTAHGWSSANCLKRAALRINSQSMEWLQSMSVIEGYICIVRLAKARRSRSTPAYLKHVHLGLRPGLRPNPPIMEPEEGGLGHA